MQTFIPSDRTFRDSIYTLDNARVNSQMREALILLGGGWYNHPIARMWKPTRDTLGLYAYDVLDEIKERGIRTTYYEDKLISLVGDRDSLILELPVWWHDPRIHDSHKARLLQKKFEHYSKFGWHNQIKSWETMEYQWARFTNDKCTEYELYQRQTPRNTN